MESLSNSEDTKTNNETNNLSFDQLPKAVGEQMSIDMLDSGWKDYEGANLSLQFDPLRQSTLLSACKMTYTPKNCPLTKKILEKVV